MKDERIAHNEIYNYMCLYFGIKSILDLDIKWKDVYHWLGKYPWVSRNKDIVASYLMSIGYGEFLVP